MSKWTTKKLIAIASLGVIATIFTLPGGAIAAAVGITGGGFATSIFFVIVLLVFTLLLINKFGAAFIGAIVYGITSLPTPIFGPPGFLPKIIIPISAGLIADCLYLLLKKNKKLAALFIGGGMTLFAQFLIITIGRLFSFPGIEKLATLCSMPLFIVAILIYGLISGYVGYLIYKKLENTTIVKRIQV